MHASLLTLDRVGFPPFSARRCQQTLAPLRSGTLRRTVNGNLLYTGQEGHHKFLSTIQCQDKLSPALEDVWRGSLVKVGCIQRLTQKIDSSRSVMLQRDPVEGSVVVVDENQQEKKIESVAGRLVILAENQEDSEKTYVFYRPSLFMRIVSYELFTDEWGFSGGWKLDLEEA